MLFEIIAIAVCLVFSAFFSGSETAMTAASRARLHQLVRDGNKTAAVAHRIRENKEMFIGTILVGNNIVNISAASIGTVLFIHAFGEEYGPIYATIALTILVLIFGEVLPKTVAIHHADKVSLIIARPLALIIRILWPLTMVVRFVIRNILQVLRIDIDKRDIDVLAAIDVIRGTIDMHHAEGSVMKENRDMLGSVLDLAQREVSEVMLHRKNVFSIDIGLEPEAIVQQMMGCPHSRVPLWKDEPENIIGVLHIRDLMQLVSTAKIGLTREMIRRVALRPWFVPESTNLADQLKAFRMSRKHFACVVDEYGAWQGIVTLEDILEEIVGEIDDEHDRVGIATIIPVGEGAVRVDGKTTLRDLNRHLDWNLPDDNATTIAGLVLHEARVIPEKGSVFEFYGYRIKVEEKKANQITQLMVERLPEQEAEAA